MLRENAYEAVQRDRVERDPEIRRLLDEDSTEDVVAAVRTGENDYATVTGNMTDLHLDHETRSLVETAREAGMGDKAASEFGTDTVSSLDMGVMLDREQAHELEKELRDSTSGFGSNLAGMSAKEAREELSYNFEVEEPLGSEMGAPSERGERVVQQSSFDGRVEMERVRSGGSDESSPKRVDLDELEVSVKETIKNRADQWFGWRSTDTDEQND
jgi:hypothetical protein